VGGVDRLTNGFHRAQLTVCYRLQGILPRRSGLGVDVLRFLRNELRLKFWFLGLAALSFVALQLIDSVNSFTGVVAMLLSFLIAAWIDYRARLAEPRPGSSDKSRKSYEERFGPGRIERSYATVTGLIRRCWERLWPAR